MNIVLSPMVHAAMTDTERAQFAAFRADRSIPGHLVLGVSTTPYRMFTGWLRIEGREDIRVRYASIADVLRALAREVTA